MNLKAFVYLKRKLNDTEILRIPYLATRIDARNYGQQDLSWHAGSVQGNICFKFLTLRLRDTTKYFIYI